MIYSLINSENSIHFQQGKQNIIRRTHHLVYQGPVTEEANRRDEGTNLNTIIKKQQQMQRRVTILTSSMTLAFYTTWTPYAINCILTMSGVRIYYKSNVYAILFAKTGTLINPILYIFLNRDIS